MFQGYNVSMLNVFRLKVSMFECFSFESLKFNFVWLPTGTWAPDRDAETDSSAERREHQETVGNASEQRRGWVGHL